MKALQISPRVASARTASSMCGTVFSSAAFRYVDIDLATWIGTRIHFNDNIALTFRLGYPMFSVGVSFFVGS